MNVVELSRGTAMSRSRPWWLFCSLCALSGFVSCVSAGWENEVGTYTYAEAVRAYGHPDACESTADGDKTCSWKITMGKNKVDREKIVLVFDSEDKLKSGQSIPRYEGK